MKPWFDAFVASARGSGPLRMATRKWVTKFRRRSLCTLSSWPAILLAIVNANALRFQVFRHSGDQEKKLPSSNCCLFISNRMWKSRRKHISSIHFIIQRAVEQVCLRFCFTSLSHVDFKKRLFGFRLTNKRLHIT